METLEAQHEKGGDDGGRWVTARIGAKGFHTEVQAGTHTMQVASRSQLGGTDKGPTPYD